MEEQVQTCLYFNLFSLTHSTGTSFKFLFFSLSRTTPAESCKSNSVAISGFLHKLHAEAPHYSWDDWSVISVHHLERIRWTTNTMALEHAHQNSETALLLKENHARPCNVKTSQWGPEFLPTFLPECSFEKLRSTVNLSRQVCHISPCPPRSYTMTTICALKLVCSLRKWTRAFGEIRLEKGGLSDEGTHNQEESEGLR